MSNGNTPPRVPPGVPSGGQFASTGHGEAHLSLVGPTVGHDDDFDIDTGFMDDLDAVASSDDLWQFVRHEDPIVRAAAAASLYVNEQQISELQHPSQPWLVRWSAARVIRPGVAARAANDPDPVVRAAALEGVDLPVDTRSALAGDTQVTRCLEVFAGAA